jgi:phage gp36-like protein
MSNFINIEDYDASIHREILDALTREDSSLVEICEDRAIAEMRCYLSGRYDCDALFATMPDASASGKDPRHQLVLMMALDIAIYHIFSIHNPMKLSQLRKERYERAVEWMKAVAAGTISIDGAPLATEERQIAAQPFRIVSNPKRHNHF